MTSAEPVEVPADDVLERSVARRNPYSVAGALGGWLAALVILLGIAGAIYSYMKQSQAPPSSASAAPATQAPATPSDAAVRHPIPQALAESDSKEPLPALDQSDGVLQATLTALVGSTPARELFRSDEMARRFVVTIDNLPRKKLPAQLLPVKPAAGSLLASPEDDGVVIAASNEARYAAYASLVTAANPKKLVATYVHFYPLLQEQYRALGYPYGAFNDRVIEAIDDLLVAPEIDGPVRLVQPRVLYEFADPQLEALSSGQKIMVRIGPRNERIAKEWLRDVRRQLTGENVGHALQ